MKTAYSRQWYLVQGIKSASDLHQELRGRPSDSAIDYGTISLLRARDSCRKRPNGLNFFSVAFRAVRMADSFMSEEPRDHHYVPQFFLRNFAVDPEQQQVATVAKNRQSPVWAKRSIERLWY